METLGGRNSVLEALRAGRRTFGRVLVAQGAQVKGSLEQIIGLCEEYRVPVERVSEQVFEALAGQVHHQGVLAEVSEYPYSTIDDLLACAADREERPFLLALDCVQDPHNVGALARTAEAVGVHGMIVPERRAADVTPAVSRASAGAVEHLLVARIVNLRRTLDQLKEERLWVVGVEQTRQSVDYRAADLDRAIALVLGSEGRGMRRLTKETCDFLVKLPMRGRVGSLNVSVAGSVLLYRCLASRE